jgi:hypothetical protein
MERRKFIQVGAATSLGGLSGCIGPIENPLNDNNDNNGNTESNPDNNIGSYRDVIPENGFQFGEGVLAMNVDIQSLQQSFDNPFEDAFDGLAVEDNPIGLVTASSLDAVEPTIEQRMSDNPLQSEILSRLGFEDGSGSIKFNNISFVGDVIVLDAVPSDSDIASSYTPETSDTELFEVYTRNNSTIGFYDGYTIVPLESSEAVSRIESVENLLTTENGKLEDTEFGNKLNLDRDGAVTIDAWKSGVSTAVGIGSYDILGLTSSVEFSSGTTTVTELLFENETTDVIDNISQDASDRSVSDEDRVASVEADWN